MKTLMILINLGGLLLAGCAAEVKQNNRPEWIDRPEPNFVGRCAEHEKDIIAQEQCAYKNALSEINFNGIIVDRWHDDNADIMYVLIKEK